MNTHRQPLRPELLTGWLDPVGQLLFEELNRSPFPEQQPARDIVSLVEIEARVRARELEKKKGHGSMRNARWIACAHARNWREAAAALNRASRCARRIFAEGFPTAPEVAIANLETSEVLYGYRCPRLTT